MSNKIFFTSDLHLGHQSVLTKFEYRPFADLEEMDEDKMVQDYAKWLNEHDCPVQMYNVGCMHWNYEPVTLDEILEADNVHN